MSSPVAPARPHHPSIPVVADDRLLRTALVLGSGLGLLDLLLQLTLPHPLANLANSSAVWALCAFALAAVARTSPARAALAGSVLLVVAVPAYHLAAITAGRSDVRVLVSPSTIAWVVLAVVAGVVFGVAGSWLHSERAWFAAAGLAAAVSVFQAEAGVRLLHAHALADLATTLLTCAVGTAVLLTAVSRPAHLARTAVLIAPFTLLGVLAFSVGGF